ncbi:amidohydrolase family protein [Chelativorans salis]|uniref:Amidohydrolase family protein n=1 Tax=Chelativorans salis TaxID=2978478 RepID=A0ABT2LVW8_9HYPH|nr:amidohydrolase family protein [Chelativorans sp. EGI FJ00035]MCT7378254.1 amidohydrolase family protein [Chelativorans sp. EGI FJ00035]
MQHDSTSTDQRLPSNAPEPCDLVVHNASVFTMDAQDTVIAGGALAVRDGRILALGAGRSILARYSADEVIDAGGAALHPGFIDAHVHVSQYTARSVLPLMEGKPITMGHWKGALTPEDEQASALLAALDYLKCGYTGFVDPGTIFAPDAVAAVADQANIRIWLADPYIADRAASLAINLPELASESFLARWPSGLDEALGRLGSQLFRNRDRDGLVRAFIGLYGEATDSPELYQAALDLACASGVRLQEHLGYLPAFQLNRENILDQPLLTYLDGRGFLGPNVTFIHMNLIRKNEIALLADRGVRVVWCPYGQLQMLGRPGTQARMAALQRSGIPIGIASDIPRASAFDGLGTLALCASTAAGDPVAAKEVLRMRTSGAAATVGAEDEVGSLEVGKQADFVIRQPNEAIGFASDPALELAVIGGRHTIRSVFVAGRRTVDAGRVVTGIDEVAVTTQAHRSARAISARIGLCA